MTMTHRSPSTGNGLTAPLRRTRFPALALISVLGLGCGALTPQETAAIVDTGLAVCERLTSKNEAAAMRVVREDPRLAARYAQAQKMAGASPLASGNFLHTLCGDGLARELLVNGLDRLLAGAAQPPAAAPQPVQCEPLSIETPRGEPAAMAPDAASAEAPGASPAPAKAP